VRESFFVRVFSLLQTLLFVKTLKELAGVQRPKIPNSFKISQYFAMKRKRSAIFVSSVFIVASSDYFFKVNTKEGDLYVVVFSIFGISMKSVNCLIRSYCYT